MNTLQNTRRTCPAPSPALARVHPPSANPGTPTPTPTCCVPSKQPHNTASTCPVQAVDGGRLPGAVRAQQAEHAVALNGKPAALDRPELAAPLAVALATEAAAATAWRKPRGGGTRGVRPNRPDDTGCTAQHAAQQTNHRGEASREAHQKAAQQPLPPQQSGLKTFCRPYTSTALELSPCCASAPLTPGNTGSAACGGLDQGVPLTAALQAMQVACAAPPLPPRPQTHPHATHPPVRCCSSSFMRCSSAATSSSRCSPAASSSARASGGLSRRTPLRQAGEAGEAP
jgi:hypothetical protein